MIARDLHGRGRVDGVLGLGGSAGTTIGTAAMRALPFGVPKLMVSTLASGQVRPYVGVARHLHDVFRRGHQRSQSHQPARAGQRGGGDGRHGRAAGPRRPAPPTTGR